jgi:hypothetical protein
MAMFMTNDPLQDQAIAFNPTSKSDRTEPHREPI